MLASAWIGPAGLVGAEDPRAEPFRRLLHTDLLRFYRIATAMLGSAVEAEDAVHDATIVAWRRFGDLREVDRFEAWFDRILVNTCRDRLRSRRRHPVVDIGPEVEARLPHLPDPARAVAPADAVERAMRDLGPDHLAVVVLRYEVDLSVRAIAERLGVREGTVKSRLHTAHARMRASMTDPKDVT
jgi:RNA polymerase sigma factor (sigma-70 family)